MPPLWFLLIAPAAAAPEILMIGRTHAGWSVELLDDNLSLEPLWAASATSEAAAQATAARMQTCTYPAPDARPGEACPNMCFTAGVPCPGSTDPSCERTVLMQNGETPGHQQILANVTDAYGALLGRLQAPDGYVVSLLKDATVDTRLYCECPDVGKWFPDEMRAYPCKRSEFDQVAKNGKCGPSPYSPPHVHMNVVGRTKGPWTVQMFDDSGSSDPLFIATAESGAAAQATATRMQTCTYPAPDAKPGEACPNMCFTAGVPCPGSTDPSCERTVLMQNGETPGHQQILANVTDAYGALLGHLQAPDGYIITGMAQALVIDRFFCECPDEHGWFPDELKAYSCDQEEFDAVAATGKCRSVLMV